MYSMNPDFHGGRLTPRQAEFLLLAANGLTNQQIANACDVSINTVKTILLLACQRLGVDSRTQAVAVALILGLIDYRLISIPCHRTHCPAHQPNQEDPEDAQTTIDEATG